jgi:hypothetical protein
MATKKKEQQIVLQAPDKDEPGFLRRSRLAISFSEALKSKNPTVQALDDMVEFILGYIIEPKDRKVAHDLLFELSENQFLTMLDSLRGETEEDPTEETEDQEQ